MKIVDLSKCIAPEAELEVVGIMPGEKLHECLLTEEESRHAVEYDDSFVIEPEHPFWDKNNSKGSKPLSEGFAYTSDRNSWWLSSEELTNMLKELE